MSRDREIELKVRLTFSDEVPVGLEATATAGVIGGIVSWIGSSEEGLTAGHDVYTTEVEVQSDELTQHWNVKTDRIETL